MTGENWTALSGLTQLVKELQQRNQELAKALDSGNRSALHLALADGDIDTVKQLIKDSPEMCFARNRDGRNPLHIAAMKGEVEILKMLVQASPHAARDIVDRGETILHLCVKHNQLETLDLLLQEMGQESIDAKDSSGNTILHLAVAGKQFEIVENVLKNSKIHVNATDANGKTAMDILYLAKKRADAKAAQTETKQEAAQSGTDSKAAQSGTDVEAAQCGTNPDREEAQSGTDPNARALDVIQDFLRQAKAKRAKDLVKGEWLQRKRDTMMVVASLIATMAFQAGVNPPGGVWQDNSNGHRAGEAVMAYNYPDSYPYFLRSNTVGFVASLSTILLLISGLPFKKRTFMWILVVIMWLTVSSMAFTYAFSIVVVTPKKDRPALSSTIVVGVIVWCSVMAILFLVHTGRLIATVIEEKWSRGKAIKRIFMFGADRPPK